MKKYKGETGTVYKTSYAWIRKVSTFGKVEPNPDETYCAWCEKSQTEILTEHIDLEAHIDPQPIESKECDCICHEDVEFTHDYGKPCIHCTPSQPEEWEKKSFKDKALLVKSWFEDSEGIELSDYVYGRMASRISNLLAEEKARGVIEKQKQAEYDIKVIKFHGEQNLKIIELAEEQARHDLIQKLEREVRKMKVKTVILDVKNKPISLAVLNHNMLLDKVLELLK